jgi:hypothetical protein
MSTQQSVGTKWYGYNQVANQARTRANFDISEKLYPLDTAMTTDETWVWPMSDTVLINTLAYDSPIPSAIQ